MTFQTILDTSTLVKLPKEAFRQQIKAISRDTESYKDLWQSPVGQAVRETYRHYSEVSHTLFAEALCNRRDNRDGMTMAEAGRKVKEAYIDAEWKLNALGIVLGKSFDRPAFYYASIRNAEGGYQPKGLDELEFKRMLRDDDFVNDQIRWMDCNVEQLWAEFKNAVHDKDGSTLLLRGWETTLNYSKVMYLDRKRVKRVSKFPNLKRLELMQGERKPNNVSVYWAVEAVMRRCYSMYVGYGAFLEERLEAAEQNLHRMYEREGYGGDDDTKSEFMRDAQLKVVEVRGEMEDTDDDWEQAETACLKVLEKLLPCTGNEFIAYGYDGLENRMDKGASTTAILNRRNEVSIERFHDQIERRLAELDKLAA